MHFSSFLLLSLFLYYLIFLPINHLRAQLWSAAVFRLIFPTFPFSFSLSLLTTFSLHHIWRREIVISKHPDTHNYSNTTTTANIITIHYDHYYHYYQYHRHTISYKADQAKDDYDDSHSISTQEGDMDERI